MPPDSNTLYLCYTLLLVIALELSWQRHKKSAFVVNLAWVWFLVVQVIFLLK